MRTAIVALRCVIHRRIHRDLLDGVQRGRGKGLANRAVDRGAGLNLATRAEVLTGVQDEAVLSYLAGRVPVKNVVCTGAVQGEAIAGVPVSVGENCLIAKTGVRAGTTQEIRMNAGTQNC